MTTNARKTDAQRLGNGKKAFNVKQVEKMIEQGGGGTEYTAGDGIDITNNVISIDNFEGLVDELAHLNEDKQDVLTAGENITIVDNVISASGGSSGGDWKLATSQAEITALFNGNVLKKEMLIEFYEVRSSPSFYNLKHKEYFRKGEKLINQCVFMNWGGFNAANNIYIRIYSLDPASISSYTSLYVTQFVILNKVITDNSVQQVSVNNIYDEATTPSNGYFMKVYYKD